MNKSTYIYILLFLLTSITLFLGSKTFTTSIVIVIIMLITFVKGQLIIDYFMGLKYVKLKYRLFVSIWLLLIIILITISFIIPIKE